MCIGNLVVRAGSDEQLTAMRAVVDESLSVLMEEEGEPAFETACDVVAHSLPGAPFRERSHLRQVVAVGQLFEQEIGQGRGGLADREPRMATPLDEGDTPSSLPQRERAERAGESRADDRDVDVD